MGVECRNCYYMGMMNEDPLFLAFAQLLRSCSSDRSRL